MLFGRSIYVCINTTLSEFLFLKCGVSQGSVLDARLYSINAYPLSWIIVKHNLQYYSYADTTQIYLQCDNTDDAIKENINWLENACKAAVSAWIKKIH